MTDPQLFTSNRSDWETPGSVDRPGSFFHRLHTEFNFDLDAAAHELNHKLPNFLTEDDDSLSMDAWPGERPWCNPPYGKGNVVGKWVKKFAELTRETSFEHMVTLITSRTDTAWFHDLVMPYADEVRFVKGRILFEVDGKPVQHYDKRSKKMKDSPATFPSAIIVWRPEPIMRVGNMPKFSSMQARLTPKKKKRSKGKSNGEVSVCSQCGVLAKSLSAPCHKCGSWAGYCAWSTFHAWQQEEVPL